jgi:hypothetical protein|tara:strand:+ start:127 stop:558 length:432 start_codon:yes stop_codon:yes gene_type:complete
MKTPTLSKLHLYQVTVIFSVLFALLGFTYNVWRMEVTEENSNIRTASFEVLLTLSSLEQLVYSAHYDGDEQEGNPRKGWVKVGLIEDLSMLTTDSVQAQAAALKTVWTDNWATMMDDRHSADQIVSAIDSTRTELKRVLTSLE